MAKEAKASGLTGPPPDPEPDELIEMPLVRAHSLEFTFRMSGLAILGYLTYLAVQFWRVMRVGGGVGLAVFYAVIAAFFLYILRLGRVFLLMMRMWNARDLQASDRRSLNQRIAGLDERERSLRKRELDLEDLQAELAARKAELDHKQVTKAVQERRDAARKRARQAAELAEIARDLENPDLEEPDAPGD
jgi:signal transduction histidine kinase